MNQFPYLYPHSLSEAERLNEEELWQDNRDAEVSHTQLTEMFRHSDPAALMDEAEQAQLAELDDTVTVYRGVTTINSDNLLALSWTLDYETADWFARRFDEDGTVYKAQIDKEHKMEECGFVVDTVLSHTCPYKYIPREAFLPMINQDSVDDSTEKWLDNIESRLYYERWYCGHWHISKRVDKLHFLFHDFEIAEE